MLHACVPAGGVCGGHSCWTASREGFTYRNRDRTPEGVAALWLRQADGELILRLRGRGPMLDLPAQLPTGVPVVTELVATDAGVFRGCWGASFSSPITSTPPNTTEPSTERGARGGQSVT